MINLANSVFAEMLFLFGAICLLLLVGGSQTLPAECAFWVRPQHEWI